MQRARNTISASRVRYLYALQHVPNHESGIDFHLRKAAPAQPNTGTRTFATVERPTKRQGTDQPARILAHHVLTPKLRIRVVGSDIRPNINLLNLCVVCKLQPSGDLVGGDAFAAPWAYSKAVPGKVTAYCVQVTV